MREKENLSLREEMITDSFKERRGEVQRYDLNQKPVVDERYIRPKAAVNKIKAAQNISQTVYIYGVTGIGKTSFIADFLSRRRYEYYTAADVNFIEKLTQKQQGKEVREKIVVIDDLHLVKNQEEREQCYRVLEELICDLGIWLILISRCRIPAWLSTLHIRYLFVTITEKELLLTREQEEQYLKKWKLELMDSSKRYLFELGRGYPIYLRIAIVRLLSADMENVKSNEERTRRELAAIEGARKDWWDYLDTYVYEQWDIEILEFLTDISIVDCFDVQMAQIITKKKEVEKILVDMFETGNFLKEKMEPGGKTIYEIEAPVRLSMRRRLTRYYSVAHINDIHYSAGSVYELQGDMAMALIMYERAHNDEAISRLLVENARKHPGSGYYWELRKYYFALPEEKIERSPELMAGMSMLQSILLNDEESERWYEKLKVFAKEQGGGAKRVAQIRLLYLDIGLPHRGTIHFTDILQNVGNMMLVQRKIVLPEFSITNNQPSQMHGGKDFCEWSRRDRQLAKSIGKIAELVLRSKGLVNLALAESFFEKGEDDYEVVTLAEKGKMKAQSNGKKEQAFVGVGILSWLSIFHNQPDDAIKSLESFRSGVQEQKQLLAGIDTLKMRFLLYTGMCQEVSDWMAEKAPDEDREFCSLERYHYISKVRVYLATGKNEKALRLLLQLLIYAEKRQRTYLQIEATMLLAIVQFRMEEKEWENTLQKAIEQAESYHFVRILSREGTALWELLRAGQFEWKEREYKKQVEKECSHMAELYPSYLNVKQDNVVLLSDKALKILRLQAEGKSVAEIGKILGLSTGGVKYYNQETYKTLGVSNKAAAIMEAKNRKIL